MSLEEIISNCESKNLKFEHVSGRNYLNIQIPKARSFGTLTVIDTVTDLIKDRDIKFLDYRYVEGYEAIWSQEHDVIECEVELPHRSFTFERIFKNNSDAIDDGKLLIDTHIPEVKVELSEVSNEFNFLYLFKDIDRPRARMRAERFDRRKAHSTSLKVCGLNITNHEKAKEVIESIFASICFQFDCKTNLPLMLSSEVNYSRVRSDASSTDELELNIVNQKYDNEALSLYWYAQSALGMPLLQFLALYQVVEFYYPIYSELAAQKKVANLLKDPCFNSHSDKDVAKVFNIVKSASSTRSEQSQLESTLKECVDVSLLRDWLKSDNKREEYFRSKNAVKLSEYKINSNVEGDDLLRQVGQRFYNIRCRIVHTKGSDGELDVLHPKSKEVQYLSHDIELANFLAHRILIASSKPINAA